jgi:hypothetical protein
VDTSSTGWCTRSGRTEISELENVRPGSPRVAHFLLDALLAGNSLLIAVNRCYSLFFSLFFPAI